MKKILFITGNSRKVWQAGTVLEPLGIEVESKELELPEIQSHDPLDITLAKAKAAFELVRQPLVVCDHSWAFHALRGFPGGYMKDLNGWFESEDWLALMSGKQDRTVTLTETVIYINADMQKEFSAKFPAKIINEARGRGANSSERVTVFDGFTETIAERIDAGGHARFMDKSAWQLFGDWYATKDAN